MKFLSVYSVFLCLWTSSPRRVYSYSLSRGDCPLNYLRCENGENVSGEYPPECFQGNRTCNNFIDCTDGSDEKYCQSNYNWGFDGYVLRFNQGTCPVNSVMCLKHNEESSCISVNALCDGFENCIDNSDEFFCPYDPVKGFRFKFEQGNCKNNSYSCGVLSDDDNNDECIDSDMICNGKIDCNNHFDETFCPYLKMESQNVSTISSTITKLNFTNPRLASEGSTNEIYGIEIIKTILSATSIQIANSSIASAMQNTNTPSLFAISSRNITMDITLDQFPFYNSSKVTDIKSTEATITVDEATIAVDEVTTTVDESNITVEEATTSVYKANITVNSNNNHETNLNNSTILSSLSSATLSYLVIFSVIMVFVNTTIIITLIVVLVLLYRRTTKLKKNQIPIKQEKNRVNYLLNNLSKWDDDP